MPGERRAHCDAGGFVVAHFADDQHLWVLPEQVTRGLGEIQSARLVHFGLHHAGNNLLGRVFDGDDVAAAKLGEKAEAGVNRRGLAAARRAGEKQQPGSLAQKFFQFSAGVLRQFQFAEIFCGGGVEQPQHDFFPAHRGIGRNADVVPTAEFRAINPAVLRHGFLVSLELGEKFDPAEDAVGDVGGEFFHGSDHAIQTKSDFRRVPAHLEMHVAGSGAFGLLDELLQNLGGLVGIVVHHRHG